MSGNRTKSEPLRDGRQQQSCFHHGKCRANALSWTSAEREICKPRQLLRSLRKPAVRIELLRLGEESRVAMHDPSAHHHIRPLRVPVTSNFEFFDHSSGQTPPLRINAPLSLNLSPRIAHPL